MTELQALIFDVDGTLADTERDGHRVAFNQAFEEAGLDWYWSVAMYGELLRVTGGKERMKLYLANYRTDDQLPEDLDAFIAGLHARKTHFYKELLSNIGIPLRTGVKRLILEAKEQGMRIAIATTTTPENVSYLLQNSLAEDAEDWFEVVAAGDIVPAKKPAPDIYTWALEKMNLSPDQVMAFEDSDNGIRSVLAAGIQSVLITVNDYTNTHDFSKAPLVLDHLGEVDQPFNIIQGQPLAKTFVDLEGLRTLHQRIHQNR